MSLWVEMVSGCELHILQRVVAERVCHRNLEVPAPDTNRDDQVPLRQLFRDDLDRSRLDRDRLQVDARHPELRGKGGGNVILAADALLDDQLTDPFGGALLFRENLLEVFPTHEPRFDEELTNTLLLGGNSHKCFLLVWVCTPELTSPRPFIGCFFGFLKGKCFSCCGGKGSQNLNRSRSPSSSSWA